MAPRPLNFELFVKKCSFHHNSWERESCILALRDFFLIFAKEQALMVFMENKSETRFGFLNMKISQSEDTRLPFSLKKPL